MSSVDSSIVTSLMYLLLCLKIGEIGKMWVSNSKCKGAQLTRTFLSFQFKPTDIVAPPLSLDCPSNPVVGKKQTLSGTAFVVPTHFHLFFKATRPGLSSFSPETALLLWRMVLAVEWVYEYLKFVSRTTLVRTA